MSEEILFNTEGFSKDSLPKQNNYETALNEAIEKLQNADIEIVARNSGTKILDGPTGKKIIVPFINDDIEVSFPEISLSYKNRDEEVEMWLKILTLHYLVYSNGTPVAGNDITFKQLEGGLGYYSAFQNRTITPLINVFDNSMKLFVETAKSITGKRTDHGKFSVSFKAFPNIKITYNLWQGDEEFPSEGNVIFDKNVSDYLTTEDIAVLCNMIAVKIIKKFKSA